jgi:hypothetical protein
MNLTVTTTQLKSWLIFLVGLGAAAYAAYAAVAHTAGVTTSGIVAAVLLGVERYVIDPSTGTTPSTATFKPPA